MSETLLAASSRDPRIGQLVQDRYRIVRKIGEGGMGAVYEGEHTVIRRKVAIKCLHAQYATNQEMVNRFQREAMAANTVRHPNIVEVTDMGRFEDGAVFMVLEFLEGSELSGLLKGEGALPLSRVVHIIGQACDALAAAHEHGIVHRDLKPDNIFILPRGEEGRDFVKVLDFGIAKFRESGGSGMTRTGMTMGTPNYMAPEQAQASKDLDHRADIYSLGVILFHCITGQLPYDDESFPMLMVKVVSFPAPRLSSLVPQIPPQIDELVHRMLAKSPAMRPSNCKEVKAVLSQFRDVHVRFAVGQAPQPISPPVTPYPSSPGTDMTRPLGGQAPIAPPGSNPSQVAHGSGPQAGYSQPGYGSSPSASAIEVPRSKLPILMILAAVLLVLGGGAAALAFAIWGNTADDPPPPPIVVSNDDPPPDPDPTPPDPDPVVDPPEVVARPEPTPPPLDPTPAAQTVRVQVSVTPADAQLFLDGNAIANPFDADLPQQTEPRRLEARHSGYRTHVQDLVLIYAQRVNITMRRGSGVDDQRRSTPRVDNTPTTRPSDPPTTTPTTTPPATPTPTTPTTPTTRPSDGFERIEI